MNNFDLRLFYSLLKKGALGLMRDIGKTLMREREKEFSCYTEEGSIFGYIGEEPHCSIFIQVPPPCLVDP